MKPPRLTSKPQQGATQALSADVRALALEVLGSDEAADEWLHTEALGMEFRRPIDLVRSAQGIKAITTLLLRMKHGVYA